MIGLLATILIVVAFPKALQPLYHLAHPRMTNEELASQLEISIQETYRERGTKLGNIISLILVRKNEGSNEYTGLLKTYNNGVKNQYTVDVLYDGENIKWEVKNN